MMASLYQSVSCWVLKNLREFMVGRTPHERSTLACRLPGWEEIAQKIVRFKTRANLAPECIWQGGQALRKSRRIWYGTKKRREGTTLCQPYCLQCAMRSCSGAPGGCRMPSR